MVALTRSSLQRVPYDWMSGANPLQTPRAWFWGTHRWAISAALLADGVSRTEQILCRPPELGFEGHTDGPYLLPWLVVEWAGLQVMFCCLVHLSTRALSRGLYANPLDMAIQSAVACSGTKDGGLLVSRQLMECVLVWVVSSSLAVEDDCLFIMDKSFDFSVGQMWWGLLLFPSFSCKLICYFINPGVGVHLILVLVDCTYAQWKTSVQIWI